VPILQAISAANTVPKTAEFPANSSAISRQFPAKNSFEETIKFSQNSFPKPFQWYEDRFRAECITEKQWKTSNNPFLCQCCFAKVFRLAYMSIDTFSLPSAMRDLI
jgi:hypothetical protein